MTNDELRAIEARAEVSFYATIPHSLVTGEKRRAIEQTVRDVPALVAAIRERDAEIARLRKEVEPMRSARTLGNVLVEVAPELLNDGTFTSQPLHVMITDNGDGTHSLTFRESEEIARLRGLVREAFTEGFNLQKDDSGWGYSQTDAPLAWAESDVRQKMTGREYRNPYLPSSLRQSNDGEAR